jgi:hypothetical protein
MEATTTQTIIASGMSAILIISVAVAILKLRQKGCDNAGKSTYFYFTDEYNRETDISPLLIGDIEGLKRVSQSGDKLQFNVIKNGVRLLQKPWKCKRIPEFLDSYNKTLADGWEFVCNPNSFTFWEKEGKFLTTEQVLRAVKQI